MASSQPKPDFALAMPTAPRSEDRGIRLPPLPTPAGIRGFQVMFVWAVTGFLGGAKDPASACAIVLHAVSFIPISILGVVFMTQDGLSLGRLSQMRSTAEAAEHPERRTHNQRVLVKDSGRWRVVAHLISDENPRHG